MRADEFRYYGPLAKGIFLPITSPSWWTIRFDSVCVTRDQRNAGHSDKRSLLRWEEYLPFPGKKELFLTGFIIAK